MLVLVGTLKYGSAHFMHGQLFLLQRGVSTTLHTRIPLQESCARLCVHRRGDKDPGGVPNVFCAMRRSWCTGAPGVQLLNVTACHGNQGFMLLRNCFSNKWAELDDLFHPHMKGTLMLPCSGLAQKAVLLSINLLCKHAVTSGHLDLREHAFDTRHGSSCFQVQWVDSTALHARLLFRGSCAGALHSPAQWQRLRQCP